MKKLKIKEQKIKNENKRKNKVQNAVSKIISNFRFFLIFPQGLNCTLEFSQLTV